MLWGTSNEYPQHMFLLRNKKIMSQLLNTLPAAMFDICCLASGFCGLGKILPKICILQSKVNYPEYLNSIAPVNSADPYTCNTSLKGFFLLLLFTNFLALFFLHSWNLILSLVQICDWDVQIF